MKNKKYKGGGASIIGLLVFAVLIVLLLNFLKINVKTVINNTEEQNTAYFNNISQNLWKDYLEKPVMNLWNNFFAGILKNITGNGMNFQNLAPTVPFGGPTNSNPSNLNNAIPNTNVSPN